MNFMQDAAAARFRAAVERAPLGVYLGPEQPYKAIPASMDPLVIADAAWQSLQRDARHILAALQKLGARLRLSPQSKLLHSLSPLEQGPADFGGLATARLDLFFDGDDLVVIEANTTIPAMQAYSDMIRAAYHAALHPTQTLEAGNTLDLLHSLLQHYERTGGRSASPRLAIVARAGDAQLAELLWLQKEWQARSYETLLLTPDALEIREGKLWSGPKPIDLTERRRKAPGFSHGDTSRRYPAELGTTSSISMYRSFLL